MKKQEIIKDLEKALEVAKNYEHEDGGMQYAYRYGVLKSAIESAIYTLQLNKDRK